MEKSKKMKIVPPMIVYWLLLLGVFTLGVFSFIGLILAYIFIGDAKKKQQTHFSYQIRTFWLFILYAIILTVATSALMAWLYSASIPFFNHSSDNFRFLLESTGGSSVPYIELRDADFQFILNISTGGAPYVQLEDGNFRFFLDTSGRIPQLEFSGKILSILGRIGSATVPYFLLWIWGFVRFIKGVGLLSRRKAIPNPKTWWI